MPGPARPKHKGEKGACKRAGATKQICPTEAGARTRHSGMGPRICISNRLPGLLVLLFWDHTFRGMRLLSKPQQGENKAGEGRNTPPFSPSALQFPAGASHWPQARRKQRAPESGPFHLCVARTGRSERGRPDTTTPPRPRWPLPFPSHRSHRPHPAFLPFS